jgi:hypothetical protein
VGRHVAHEQVPAPLNVPPIPFGPLADVQQMGDGAGLRASTPLVQPGDGIGVNVATGRFPPPDAPVEVPLHVCVSDPEQLGGGVLERSLLILGSTRTIGASNGTTQPT